MKNTQFRDIYPLFENFMPALTIPSPRPARRATLTAKVKNSPVGIAASPRQSNESNLYMMLFPHSALSDFILERGDQNQEKWNILSFRLHLAQTLMTIHASHEAAAIDTVRDGIYHLITTQALHAKTGVWKLSRIGQQCVGDALHYADLIQQLTTRAQERAAAIALVKSCLKDLGRLGMTEKLAQRILAA